LPLEANSRLTVDPGLRRDDGIEVDRHFTVTPVQAGVQGLMYFSFDNSPLSWPGGHCRRYNAAQFGPRAALRKIAP